MSEEPLSSSSEFRAIRAELHRRLLAWYRRHRRPLPWRESRDPYAIWLSEVMLQQTRVSSVLPYYRSFLDRFPTLQSLARAAAPEVLAAWAGLGYYRRARLLHEAARTVVREHAGRVPDDPESFGRLPGVGRYTLGAVLSIAYGRPLPVVDGNVARVLARLFLLETTVRDATGSRRLWQRATSLLPMRDPGDWNQALMELGATVCVPAAPRCGECPVAGLCRARAAGRAATVPAQSPRRAAERVRRAVALVVRGGRMLVVRRSGALLDGLWEPPGIDLVAGEPAGEGLEAALRRLGVEARLEPTGRLLRHRITHRALEVEVWRETRARAARAPRPGGGTRPAGGARRDGAGSRPHWVDPAAPGVAFSALGRRASALCAGTEAEATPVAARRRRRPGGRATRR